MHVISLVYETFNSYIMVDGYKEKIRFDILSKHFVTETLIQDIKTLSKMCVLSVGGRMRLFICTLLFLEGV